MSSLSLTLNLARLGVDGNSGCSNCDVLSWQHSDCHHGLGSDEVFPRRRSTASAADTTGEEDTSHSEKEAYYAEHERDSYELAIRMIRDVIIVAETLKPRKNRNVYDRPN